MKRYWSLLLIVSCLSLNAFGQGEHFLSIKSGAGIGKVKDRMVSSLVYQGFQVPSELAYIRKTDTSSRKVEIGFTWGEFKTDLREKRRNTSVQRYKMQANFNSFTKVSDWRYSHFSLYLGGAWNNLLTFRNNSFAGLNFGEFVSTVSFKPQVNYDLKVFDHKAKFTYSLGFPFLTFIARRGFANSPPEGFQQDEDDRSFVVKTYESVEVLRPLEFLRFNAQLQFSYHLKNGNYLSLSYGFDYYEYEKPELLESVSHNLMFGTAIHF